MAKTTSQSALMAELKKLTKGAWTDARAIVAKPKGFQELPGGLQGAIGKVTGCDFKMSEDKGKGSCPQATIKFIVKEPGDFAGTPQSKSFFFSNRTGDFPKSAAEVLEDFSNDLQLLGCETGDKDEDQIPELLAELSKRKPYFKFNTSRFNDRTYHQIQGLAVDYVPAADDVESVEPNNAEAVVAAAEAGRPAPGGKKPKAPPPKATPKPADDGIEEVDDNTVPTVELYVPVVGHRFYVTVNGEQHPCEVLEVLDAEEKCILQDETAEKKIKVSFQKIRDDNQE